MDTSPLDLATGVAATTAPGHSTGLAFVYGLAHLSFALYVAALGLRISGCSVISGHSVARNLWTGSWLVLVCHILLAFHVVHRWSHDSALAETARQTSEVFRVATPAGLYVNYVFLGVWLFDALWWWVAGEEAYQSRPRWAEAAVQGFLAFIQFNATIVFGGPAIRAFAVLGAATLAILRWRLTESFRRGDTA